MKPKAGSLKRSIKINEASTQAKIKKRERIQITSTRN